MKDSHEYLHEFDRRDKIEKRKDALRHYLEEEEDHTGNDNNKGKISQDGLPIKKWKFEKIDDN